MAVRMSEEKNYKEFWVGISDTNVAHINPKMKYGSDYHVIEYAAYEELKAANEQQYKHLVSVADSRYKEMTQLQSKLEYANDEIHTLKNKLSAFEGMTFSENKELAQLKSDLSVAVEALKRLSESGDGTSGDKKASFYDCLPTLQIEFSERKEFAREALSKIKGNYES